MNNYVLYLKSHEGFSVGRLIFHRWRHCRFKVRLLKYKCSLFMFILRGPYQHEENRMEHYKCNRQSTSLLILNLISDQPVFIVSPPPIYVLACEHSKQILPLMQNTRHYCQLPQLMKTCIKKRAGESLAKELQHLNGSDVTLCS